VTAQVASSARSARALAGAILAASFVIRAVGDVRGGTLSWLSPLGWAQSIRAYADERWWVLALPFAATAGLLHSAVWLQAKRDFGAGLRQERPGAARATPTLRTPLALAMRLQRSAVIGWTSGLALVAFFYGIVADQAESIIEDNPDIADFFAQLGQASITDAFLATSVLILALTASGFTVASVLRLRTEEVAHRADPVLATPTRRVTWVWSHLLVAAAGSLAVMTVVGASLGAGFALMTGEPRQVVRLTAAGVAMVPAMLVVAAITLTLCALVPKWAVTAWGALAAVVVIGIFEGVLKLPQWFVDVSPFEHVPALPAAPFDALPLLVLCAAAAAIAAVGLLAYGRRDIG
jgi:ABC-2 type transport system permease protein